MYEDLIVYILCTPLVLLNLYASYRCMRSEYSESKQKIAQFFVVWLIPIIGPLLVIHFSKAMDIRPNYKSSDSAPGIDVYPGNFGAGLNDVGAGDIGSGD